MNAIETGAAVLGLLGTLLLATKSRWAGWGFVAYLVSNMGWLMFAWQGQHWPLLVQHIGFMASSSLGVWVWLVKPLIQEKSRGACST